jgi:hypothetical protein
MRSRVEGEPQALRCGEVSLHHSLRGRSPPRAREELIRPHADIASPARRA